MDANLHSWDLSPAEAAQVQTNLRKRLVLTWDQRSLTTIAGVDISIKTDPAAELGTGSARAAIVVLQYPNLQPLEAVTADAPLVFPYIPGFLAFREGPAVLAAWSKLQNKPDLLMFDGQGIAHPRGVGIAAQMGLWLERPTIGVAKSRLYGRHEEVGPQRGVRASLLDKSGNIIGTVLRTRERANTLYRSEEHTSELQSQSNLVCRLLL